MAKQTQMLGIDEGTDDPTLDPNSPDYSSQKQQTPVQVPSQQPDAANPPVTMPAPAPVLQTDPQPQQSSDPVQDVIAQQAAALPPQNTAADAAAGIPSNIIQAHGVNGQIIAMPGQDVSATMTQPVAGAAAPVAGPASNAALYQQQLAALMGRSLVPQATDPEIAAPLAANRLAEDRATAQQRAFLAERDAHEGTNNSGGFDTGNLGILEDSAQRQGEFAGGLYKDATNNRINQLLQTLALEGNRMSEEDRNALTAELERLRLSQSQSQFDTGNALQLGEFNAVQNTDALKALAALISAGGA